MREREKIFKFNYINIMNQLFVINMVIISLTIESTEIKSSVKERERERVKVIPFQFSSP